MKRRQLSESQIAERDARRERIRAIGKGISELTQEQRLALAAKVGLVTIGEEGRGLSTFNQLLVIQQNPNATCVGGFRQWIKAGRCVRKGEHGCSIYVPIGHKDEDGNITDKVGFVCGTVFDVSQTEPLEDNGQAPLTKAREAGELSQAVSARLSLPEHCDNHKTELVAEIPATAKQVQGDFRLEAL